MVRFFKIFFEFHAENLSSEEVVVVAEGEKENIEELIKVIERCTSFYWSG